MIEVEKRISRQVCHEQCGIYFANEIFSILRYMRKIAVDICYEILNGILVFFSNLFNFYAYNCDFANLIQTLQIIMLQILTFD